MYKYQENSEEINKDKKEYNINFKFKETTEQELYNFTNVEYDTKELSKLINITDEQIAEFVTKSRGEQEFRELRPVVKIDGWLSTKANYSENDRQALELYWKKWFSTLDLDEPDFGF